MRFRHRDTEIEVDVSLQDGRVSLTRGDAGPVVHDVRAVGTAEFALTDAGGGLHTVYAVRDGAHWWINLDGRTFHLERVVARGGASRGAGSLASPIPATVQEVLVADGDTVEESQVLLVLSAMKMQLEIKAPHAGTVTGLELSEGDRVDAGAPLLQVEPAAKGD